MNSAAIKSGVKVIIIPGNGCQNIKTSNWYGHLHNQLTSSGITSVCQNFPDPYEAKRSIWIPFIESLGTDSNTILVGHSSGAQASLRYAETHPLRAVVLVSATYTDLGCESERISGYYPQGDTNTYDFESMRSNCGVWHQFHSDDDPFIPVDEAKRIEKELRPTCFHLLSGRSHFFEPFPELFEVVEMLCREGSNDQ